MNQKMLVLSLVIVLVLAGVGLFYFSQKSTDSNMMKDDAITVSEDVMQKNDDTAVAETDMMQKNDAMLKSSTYIEYSPAALVEAASKKRVLFFYANWCPTCRPADADFKANNAKIPSNTTLIRVNYNDSDTDDAEKALAKKYNVTYQHTYVQIDATGNQIAIWNGGALAELLENIK